MSGPSLVETIRAELAAIQTEKQAAAASHSTGRYDNLIGRENGLRWVLRLLIGDDI
jgi:hypothetical protein